MDTPWRLFFPASFLGAAPRGRSFPFCVGQPGWNAKIIDTSAATRLVGTEDKLEEGHSDQSEKYVRENKESNLFHLSTSSVRRAFITF